MPASSADRGGAGLRVLPLGPELEAEVPLAALLALARDHLGPGALPWSEEAWRWKHVDNPFGPSLGLVALAGGRPVALRAFQPWGFRQGGERRPAARAVDTVVHRDWRGRGLFRRLTLAGLDLLAGKAVGFVFNTPNAQSRPGYLAMGWRALGRPALTLAPRRWPRRRPGAAPPAIDAPAAADWLATPEAADLVEAENAAAAAGGRLATARSVDYLAWRYAAAPGLDYRALWRREGEAAAAVVCRARRRFGLGEVTVAEAMARGGAAGVELLTGLLADLARRTAGAEHLLALAPTPPLGAAFRRAGFLPVGRRGPLVTVRSLPAAPPPPPLAGWRLAAGDLEVF